MIAHQLLGRQREQHLAPVTSREEPSYPVYRWAEVVPIPLLCRARVQSHPHQKGLGLLPFGREEPTLGLQGGFQGIRAGWEGGIKGVTNSLEDVATTLCYGTP